MALNKWLKNQDILSVRPSAETPSKRPASDAAGSENKKSKLSVLPAPCLTIAYATQTEELEISRNWIEFLDFDSCTLERLLSLKRQISNLRQYFSIFPPAGKVHRWSYLCSPDDVKVVILGQDPYPTAGRADGLAFSTGDGTVSPSLHKIYQEIARCYPAFQIPKHGCLDSWAKQGVLLLNTTFTVLEGRAGSHAKIGWKTLSDAILQRLSDRKTRLVFMLWGNHAKSKKSLISNEHLVLTSAHPSPLARSGRSDDFAGSKHFILANDYLSAWNKQPINWSLP